VLVRSGKTRAPLPHDGETLVTALKPSVLLATRNRASILEAVLNEYCRLQAPLGGWDVVIVDNGSTDRTKDVIHGFRDRLPITYCFEPTPGKNAALNAGLPFVTGDLIVFTDDDIFPRPDWLVELCAAAAAHESYSIFGGIILPRWETPPSDLIREAIPQSMCFGIHVSGMHEGPGDSNRAFGGNVAIRADVFHAGYRFDTSVGPRPTSYAMGGETNLIRRLVGDGLGVWCSERAIVEHLVPRAHLETSWILKRAERWGRARARFDAVDAPGPVATWLGIPRWIFRAAMGHIGAAAHAAFSGDSVRLFRARWDLRELLGWALEARESRNADHRRATASEGLTRDEGAPPTPARRRRSE
jgi:glycosyltransferase involved in cell wall biosynthesis